MTLVHDLDVAAYAPLRAPDLVRMALALERGLTVADPERGLRLLDELRQPTAKYSLIAQAFADPWFTFMNYGYVGDLSVPLLGAGEEMSREAVGMYHVVCSATALAGRDVLEIGCGRGGGAAFVAREHAPQSMSAIDATASNILACRAAHPQVTFEHMRAEELAFADASFDAVLCIESCKYYRPFRAFVEGARRVLRPGGTLLLALYGSDDTLAAIAEAFADWQLQREIDLSAGVRTALAQLSAELPGRLALRETLHDPALYRDFFGAVLAAENLRSGEQRYVCFVLRR